MAAVFVTATMGPFLRPGSMVDVTISSAGDARSLEGGVLLMTPLYGPDGQIYAEGQGPLVLGGYAVNVNGNSKQFNHPTTARIPNGAIVERAVPLELKQMKSFSLLLNEEDFRTAERLAEAVNRELKRPLARAVDSRRIDLAPSASDDMPALLAAVEAVEVEVYPRAKVVVNERTGTVVIGGDVRLQPVSILHGGLTVDVVSEFQVSQPNPFGGGTTEVVQQTQVQAQDRPVSHIELKQGATVDDLVQNLQQIGATARDIISILQAMKEAGRSRQNWRCCDGGFSTAIACGGGGWRSQLHRGSRRPAGPKAGRGRAPVRGQHDGGAAQAAYFRADVWRRRRRVGRRSG